MEIIIEVERTTDGGFVARDAFGIQATAATEEAAVTELRLLIAEREKAGIRRRTGSERRGFGIFRNNSMFEEWKQEMAAARAEIEADPNRP